MPREYGHAYSSNCLIRGDSDSAGVGGDRSAEPPNYNNSRNCSNVSPASRAMPGNFGMGRRSSATAWSGRDFDFADRGAFQLAVDDREVLLDCLLDVFECFRLGGSL